MVVPNTLVDLYTCPFRWKSHFCHSTSAMFIHGPGLYLFGLPTEFEGMDKTLIFKVVQLSALGVQYFNPKCLPATRIHVE